MARLQRQRYTQNPRRNQKGKRINAIQLTGQLTHNLTAASARSLPSLPDLEWRRYVRRLRDALAENPAIAFQAVLHNFVLTVFYRLASSGSCLEIGLRTPTFPAQAPGLRESASAKAAESWKARLPKGRAISGMLFQPSMATHRHSLRVVCGQRCLRAGQPLQSGPCLRPRCPYPNRPC